MVFEDHFPLVGKRIWVTGSSGFLGTRVVEELIRRGAQPLRTRSAEVDLLDPYAAASYLKKERPDGVIHLAGKVGGIGANRLSPGSFFYSNMAMGLHLIEACREFHIQKILVVGTVCSYPKFCPTPFHEADLWNGYPEETNAPYGIAKKALLVQLQSYRQEFGLNGIFIIPVNLYGPGDHLDLENNHVIPALVKRFIVARMQSQPRVTLWGTGAASREFLFVEDAAQGLCDALARYEGADPVNLGTGEEISILHLAARIQALTGYAGELKFDPTLPDGQPRRRLEISRARNCFGWVAQVKLEEGLRRTVEWMQKKLER
jgi:GDP-L-fucose synthase